MTPAYIERIGRRLLQESLVSGNLGNMSIRSPEGFLITRTGSCLDDPGPLVLCPFEGPVPSAASSEYRVHRDIYKNHGYQAIVHVHPPHLIAASFYETELVLKTFESQVPFESIPVVTGRPGSDELARSVAEAIVRSPIVIAHGHGSFAAARSLEEAYLVTSLAEHSARVLLLTRQKKGSLLE